MTTWTVEELRDALAMENPEKTVIIRHGNASYMIEDVDPDPDPDHTDGILVVNVRKVVMTRGCEP